MIHSDEGLMLETSASESELTVVWTVDFRNKFNVEGVPLGPMGKKYLLICLHILFVWT